MRSNETSALAASADRGAVERLAASVVTCLGTMADSTFGPVLAASVTDPADFEASVRIDTQGALRAGRMMIERAGRQVFEAIAQSLDIAVPPEASVWFDLAEREGVPTIVGWDLRTGDQRSCIKLYVNSSDASHTTRARICASLATKHDLGGEAPAVIGLNSSGHSLETKLYIQSADALALASGHGDRALQLATAARKQNADAGGVLSLDATRTGLHPRAFFVALREPDGATPWQCVATVPGHDAARIAALLPFPPAPPRSVGVSLTDEAWTLYYKPRHSGHAPASLEPAAIFADGVSEVGVFIEPNEKADRAFRRTGRHAVSIRVREGSPSPIEIESLVDWFTDRLSAVEDASDPPLPVLADPPAPWHVVAAEPPARRATEAS